MDNNTTVSGYNTTRNQILGRLSQCKDAESLHRQLTAEADAIEAALLPEYTLQDKAAIIGLDITAGIKEANDMIAESKLDE